MIAKIFYRIWIYVDQPELIICNFLWHGESSVFNKNRDTMIFHNPYSQIPGRYFYAMKYLSKSSSIIFDSNHSRNQFKELYGKYNNCKMIHTGVDTEYFKPSKINKNTNRLNLISIGEFEERKGIQYLIKAIPDLIKQFPKVYLRIIGSGKFRNHYQQLVNQLNIGNYVIIQPPVNDTKPYLLISDIYFLLSDGEGFPLGLLEAMSCGLPTIVSDSPPFEEIINKNVGCRVNRENPESILRAVTKLSDKETRSYMGSKARDLIKKRYSWTNIAEQYYNLIKEQ